jgi:hypothetical protein
MIFSQRREARKGYWSYGITLFGAGRKPSDNPTKLPVSLSSVSCLSLCVLRAFARFSLHIIALMQYSD